MTIIKKRDIISKRRFGGTVAARGYSSVGRAFEWHSKGRRFDPDYLHHMGTIRTGVVKEIPMTTVIGISFFLFTMTLIGSAEKDSFCGLSFFVIKFCIASESIEINVTALSNACLFQQVHAILPDKGQDILYICNQ